MRLPLRIAILECDTPLDGTRERYGGYGGVFTALLKAGAATLGRDDISSTAGLEITKWDVEKAETYPHLGDIDAILITGSSTSSGAIEWGLSHVFWTSSADSGKNRTHLTTSHGLRSWSSLQEK